MVLFVYFFSETVNFCTDGKIGCYVTHVLNLMVFEKKWTKMTILTDEDVNKDQSGTSLRD
jgi:hypothetical protein